MKLAALICVCVWAATSLWRMPVNARPYLLLAYLVAQGCYSVAQFGILRALGEGHSLYRSSYFAGNAILLGFAFLMMRESSSVHPAVHGFSTRWFVLGACVLFGVALAALVGVHIFAVRGRFPLAGYYYLGTFAPYVVVGAALLASLAGRASELEWLSRLTLGLGWTVHGAFGMIFCLGYTRNPKPWLAVNQWFPDAVALVCFGALALFLAVKQSELSRQSLNEVQRLDARAAHVAAVAVERSSGR